MDVEERGEKEEERKQKTPGFESEMWGLVAPKGSGVLGGRRSDGSEGGFFWKYGDVENTAEDMRAVKNNTQPVLFLLRLDDSLVVYGIQISDVIPDGGCGQPQLWKRVTICAVNNGALKMKDLTGSAELNRYLILTFAKANSVWVVT